MSEPTNEVAIKDENIRDEEQPELTEQPKEEEAKEEPKRVRINDIANEKRNATTVRNLLVSKL